MYFKPRIFISSTLKLTNIRKKVNEFFCSVGADALVYEQNLTPSINNAAYREDIKDSDFVIFILDKFYGTPTDTGMSGTHEEWIIAKEAKIPKHVYIKKLRDKKAEAKQKKFIQKEIYGNYVSFYFFKDEADLLRRIKETTFTIAKEIALNNIDKLGLPHLKTQSLAISSDYSRASVLIKDFEEIKRLGHERNLSLLDSTLIASIHEIWTFAYKREFSYFVDSHYNTLFETLLQKANAFITKHSAATISNGHIDITLPSSLPLYVATLTFGVGYDHEQLINLLKEFIESYEAFKKFVFDRKTSFDVQAAAGYLA